MFSWYGEEYVAVRYGKIQPSVGEIHTVLFRAKDRNIKEKEMGGRVGGDSLHVIAKCLCFNGMGQMYVSCCVNV